MKKLTIFAIVLIANFLTAQNPSFEWAKKVGGTNDDFVASIAVDITGNIYTVGYFKGTVDFDPSNDQTVNLTSTGTSNNIFISKLDPDGNLIWVKSIGGSFGERGADLIELDALGNIYISGSFNGITDFDPSNGLFNLTASITDYFNMEWYVNVFILKLDANGNFLWVKNLGETHYVKTYNTKIDLFGNVYITGGFKGTVDFDPGEGVFNLTTGPPNTFISKLDKNGNFLWVKSTVGGGDGFFDSTRKAFIDIDANNNIYLTSLFNGTIDFDPGENVTNLSSGFSPDIFLLKLDPNGNFLWVKNMNQDAYNGPNSIKVDPFGNIYVIGHFNGSQIDCDPGEGVTILDGNIQELDDNVFYYPLNTFISKFDTDGNFIWVKGMIAETDKTLKNLHIDAYGNVYEIGIFKGTVDFDSGPDSLIISSVGNYDIYILKIDIDGNIVWVKTIGGTQNESSGSILVDQSGNIYTTGGFKFICEFDPALETFNIIFSEGQKDGFIQKMSQNSELGIMEKNTQNLVNVYPNPTNDILNIDIKILNDEDKKMELINSLGQIVINQSIDNKHLEIDTKHLTNGVYFLKVFNDNKIFATEKIIIK